MWAKGISEGGYVGATTHQGVPGGCWRALVGVAHPLHSPQVLFAPKIHKYSEKIVLNFQGILRIFIFGSFFLHGENRKRDKHGILYYLTN